VNRGPTGVGCQGKNVNVTVTLEESLVPVEHFQFATNRMVNKPTKGVVSLLASCTPQSCRSIAVKIPSVQSQRINLEVPLPRLIARNECGCNRLCCGLYREECYDSWSQETFHFYIWGNSDIAGPVSIRFSWQGACYAPITESALTPPASLITNQAHREYFVGPGLPTSS
jgi:hypothetical protein